MTDRIFVSHLSFSCSLWRNPFIIKSNYLSYCLYSSGNLNKFTRKKVTNNNWKSHHLWFIFKKGQFVPLLQFLINLGINKKNNVLLPQTLINCAYPVYALWCSYSHKLLNYLAFKSFDHERTWWRLIQKRVVCTKIDIYVFINVCEERQNMKAWLIRHKRYISSCCQPMVCQT